MADPHETLLGHLSPTACGVEIGAHTIPVPGITPYYVDQVFMFGGSAGKIDVQADATALPMPNGELDYVCSSHVLEHLPNPVAALLEWRGVLRPGGLLYLVVPDKRFTFDAPRPVTEPAHLIDDFRDDTSTADEQHIRDFIYGCDWDRLGLPPHPEGRERHRQSHYDLYVSRITVGAAVDIHYHTFTPESLCELLRRLGMIGGFRPMFRVLARAEKLPANRGDGIGLLLEKLGSYADVQNFRTYEQRHARGDIRSLKLVCPATLAPLSRSDGPTNPMLLVDGRSHHYTFSGAVPVLLRPKGVAAQRTWNTREERQRLLRASRGRRFFPFVACRR